MFLGRVCIDGFATVVITPRRSPFCLLFLDPASNILCEFKLFYWYPPSGVVYVDADRRIFCVWEYDLRQLATVLRIVDSNPVFLRECQRDIR
jgi:hypothetical protein